MPLADLRPEPANRGRGLAQIPTPPSLVPIQILSLTFTDLPSPLRVGEGHFLFSLLPLLHPLLNACSSPFAQTHSSRCS